MDQQATIGIHLAAGEFRRLAVQRLAREWGGTEIRIRDRACRFCDCQILVADGGKGLLAYDPCDRPTVELVALNAFEPRRGIATAPLEDLVHRLQADGYVTLRLATTNDNLDALRFYQRRGFRIAALRPGAVDDARRVKPAVCYSSLSHRSTVMTSGSSA